MEFSKEGSANFFVSNRFKLNNMHEVVGMKNLEKYKLNLFETKKFAEPSLLNSIPSISNKNGLSLI